MKAADGLHVEWVEGEAVVLNPESGELHYLNGPAAVVFALIQEHGYEQGVQELKKTYPDNPDLGHEVHHLIEDMVAKKLLVDD